MAEYQTVTVEIVMEKGDDLFNRIQSYADANGTSFEEAVQYVATFGITHFINENLDLLDYLDKRHNLPRP